MRIIVAVALGFLIPAAIQSQGAREQDVRAVVDSFLIRAQNERWPEAVLLLDLTIFERYFRRRVGMARAALPQPEPTVERMMADDPQLPRAVAEWHIAQMKKYRGERSHEDVSDEFTGITTFRALAALTAGEAAARHLEASDGRSSLREWVRRDTCASKVTIPIDSLFRGRSWKVHGVAFDSDSNAHVVYSDAGWSSRQGEDFHSEPPQVIELRRRSDGVWRILYKSNLLRTNVAVTLNRVECPRTR